jgi:serine/threonine protein kinase
VATVLKAVCISTNTKVIIKAYYKSKMHPKHYHKLQREIETMKMLNGPYVAEFYAHFEDAQCIYIIMEYCEGGDLFKTMLMHGGLLDEQWVCVEVRNGMVAGAQGQGVHRSRYLPNAMLLQVSSRSVISPAAGSCPVLGLPCCVVLLQVLAHYSVLTGTASCCAALRAQVITPLLRILEKMHGLMLLHRDIKPENIFLTGLGKFKLGDFGLAIRFDKELPFSRSGTLDYMAPEVRMCTAAWRM